MRSSSNQLIGADVFGAATDAFGIQLLDRSGAVDRDGQWVEVVVVVHVGNRVFRLFAVAEENQVPGRVELHDGRQEAALRGTCGRRFADAGDGSLERHVVTEAADQDRAFRTECDVPFGADRIGVVRVRRLESAGDVGQGAETDVLAGQRFVGDLRAVDRVGSDLSGLHRL